VVPVKTYSTQIRGCEGYVWRVENLYFWARHNLNCVRYMYTPGLTYPTSTLKLQTMLIWSEFAGSDPGSTHNATAQCWKPPVGITGSLAISFSCRERRWGLMIFFNLSMSGSDAPDGRR
jgi:hypothetical protein